MAYATGERHPRVKLTDAQVREMRSLYDAWKANGSHKGYAELGAVFQTSMWTVRDIITFRTRRSVW